MNRGRSAQKMNMRPVGLRPARPCKGRKINGEPCGKESVFEIAGKWLCRQHAKG